MRVNVYVFLSVLLQACEHESMSPQSAGSVEYIDSISAEE